MARPSAGDTCISPYPDLDHSPYNPRKRARQPSDDPSQDCNDDTHKTRRVNPQRLAVRLGPELVTEMEALIFPGAKMPSFEVRKVLQEKYSVDRRHIYDYFHSRGLRVAKEDRHLNLTRGRLAKALQKQAFEVHVQDENTIPFTASEDRISREMDLARFKDISSGNSSIADSESTHSNVPKSGSSSSIFVRRLESIYFPRDRVGVCSGMNSQTAKDVTERDQDSDICADAKSLFPESTVMEKSVIPCHDWSCDLPSQSPFNVEEIKAEFSLDTPFDGRKPDPLAAVHTHRPLTEHERLALYNLINESTGSSVGIEERQGTYSAYMEGRSRLSFDGLFPKGTCERPKASTDFSPTDSGDDVDFPTWFLDPNVPEGDLTIGPRPETPGRTLFANPAERAHLTPYSHVTSSSETSGLASHSLLSSGYDEQGQLFVSCPSSEVLKISNRHKPLNAASLTQKLRAMEPSMTITNELCSFECTPNLKMKQYQCPSDSRKHEKSVLRSTISATTEDIALRSLKASNGFPDRCGIWLAPSKLAHIRTASAGGGI